MRSRWRFRRAAKPAMEIDGLVFQIAAVPAGKPLPHGAMASTDFTRSFTLGSRFWPTSG